MYLAKRRMKFRGIQYLRGDVIPAENSQNRLALISTGWIEHVKAPPSPPESEPEQELQLGEAVDDLMVFTRAELNERALVLGVDNPEGFANKSALIDEMLSINLTTPNLSSLPNPPLGAPTVQEGDGGGPSNASSGNVAVTTDRLGV